VLNEDGRLSPKTHDETFINQLRKTLLIPDGEDVTTFLSRGTTDTTTLLVAILTSLEPFGWMLRDIYDLFVRHGVNASDEQLLIEFDFGDSRKKLPFDLSSFLAGVETLEKLSQSIEVHAFTYLDLRSITKNLVKALVEVCDPSQVGQAVNNSLGSHHPFEQWIGVSPYWPYSTLPPLPLWEVGYPLQRSLSPILTAALRLCTISGTFANASASSLAAKGSGGKWEPGSHVRANVSSWGTMHVHSIQYDLLAVNLLRLIWKLFELAPKNASERLELAEQISKEINEHSDLLSIVQTVRALKELLDLPIWKQRSHIYSIWLVTVFERAVVPTASFRLHTEDGRIIFRFDKTKIAMITVGEELLVLVAEMRTSSGGAEARWPWSY
jgi:hypothetical protein